MHGHNRLNVARQDVNNRSEVEKKACFVLRLARKIEMKMWTTS